MASLIIGGHVKISSETIKCTCAILHLTFQKEDYKVIVQVVSRLLKQMQEISFEYLADISFNKSHLLNEKFQYFPFLILIST